MSPSLRFAILPMALLLTGALSVSARPSAPQTAPSSSPAPKPRPSVRPAVDADDSWLIDAEGRRYRRSPLPKAQGHQKEGAARLRTVWGIVIDLDGEDEQNFYVKTYRTDDTKTGPVVSGPTEKARAAVAATYAFNTPTRALLRFERFDQGLPTAGQWRNGFELRDMDGDGAIDIVHPPARKTLGPPVIFRGDGKGNWARWREAVFPQQRFDYGDVTVADFNQDGRPDIALAMHLLGVSVLLNEGGGRFRDGSAGMDPLGVETAFSSRAITTGDWDGDGRPDLYALGEGPRLRLQGGGPLQSSDGVVLYHNRPDGTWEKRITEDKSAFGDSIAVLRLENARAGLVAGSNNRGAANLLLVLGAEPWATARVLDNLRPQALVRSVAVADIDRDGFDDVVVGYSTFELGHWRSGIDLMLQRPLKSTWERQALYAEDGSIGVSALAAGDLTGDSRSDIAALTGDGRVMVFVAAGRGRFTRDSTKLLPVAPACRGYHVAIADIDADGFGDIVAGFAGEPEGFAGAMSPGCPGEGSLRAWRVRPIPPPAPKKPATSPTPSRRVVPVRPGTE